MELWRVGDAEAVSVKSFCAFGFFLSPCSSTFKFSAACSPGSFEVESSRVSTAGSMRAAELRMV